MIQMEEQEMSDDLADLIAFILEMVLLVDLYKGYQHVPDEYREEWLDRDVVREMAYHVTGIGTVLTQELLTIYSPDLLFSFSKPVVDRLEKDHLEFSYSVEEDRLVGRLKHTASRMNIAYPLSIPIEGLADKLLPYRMSVDSIH